MSTTSSFFHKLGTIRTYYKYTVKAIPPPPQLLWASWMDSRASKNRLRYHRDIRAVKGILNWYDASRYEYDYSGKSAPDKLPGNLVIYEWDGDQWHKRISFAKGQDYTSAQREMRKLQPVYSKFVRKLDIPSS